LDEFLGDNGISKQGADMKSRGILFLALMSIAAWALIGPGGAMAKSKGPMDSPKAFLIKPQKDPKGGKTAFVNGTATVQPSHLEVKSLWITQPVKLVVVSEEKGKEVKVELRKYHWQKPWKTCSTGVKGDCGFALRHQGDLYITLISPSGPAPVFIGVQVGDEDKPKMKPVLVPKGE
jgi:hypothetical protein